MDEMQRFLWRVKMNVDYKGHVYWVYYILDVAFEKGEECQCARCGGEHTRFPASIRLLEVYNAEKMVPINPSSSVYSGVEKNLHEKVLRADEICSNCYADMYAAMMQCIS